MEDLSKELRNLEAHIKTLLNSQLKDICKKEGLPVTGIKATLQARILERLRDFITSGDVVRFAEFRQKIKPSSAPYGHNANAAAGGAATSNGYTTAQYADQFRTMPNSSRSVQHSHGAAPNTLPFAPSPFYAIRGQLTKPEVLPIMSQNRNTVTTQVMLAGAQIDLLKGGSLAVMVFSTADPTYTPGSANVIGFPAQVELKVNGDTFSGNLRGIKKKAGTTRPADITSLIRKLPGYTNNVSVTYAATDKRYQFVVCLVEKTSTEQLVERIRGAPQISKQSVINDMLSKAKDPDIVVGSTVMSLKCPLSFMRISLPCRFTVCNHNRCFDATSFLQIQEQAPQWACPICNKVSSFENLAIDCYVKDILQNTSSSIDSVVIEPTGAWRVASKADEDKKDGLKAAKEEPTDIDFLEILENPTTSTFRNGLTQTSTPPASTREPSAASSSKRTGQKRKAEVIDLTLSSDDDEPPRPIKRNPSGSNPGSANPTTTANASEYQRASFASPTGTTSFSFSGNSLSRPPSLPANSGGSSGGVFGQPSSHRRPQMPAAQAPTTQQNQSGLANYRIPATPRLQVDDRFPYGVPTAQQQPPNYPNHQTQPHSHHSQNFRNWM